MDSKFALLLVLAAPLGAQIRVAKFQPDDATEAIQAALDSKARTVVIPYTGEPWIVRPLRLRGNQEVIFEPGVLVLAKQGEFKGKGDSLFTAAGESNLTLRGYGATLRMRKSDYQSAAYEKAEWRMGVALRNCRHVLIEGLRVESTGGDGFYVDGGEDITIRNCVAHDNHRQGISVISINGLLVENCVFSNTRGTAPEAGIDLEPDTAQQHLVNCVIRNCIFESNHGHAMLVYLRQLTRQSDPVSIRFENCLARMTSAEAGGWAGMAVGAAGDQGPKGRIEFLNCTAENTGREGAKVYDKSADSVLVRFANCAWKDPWIAPAPDYSGPRVPVLLQLRNSKITQRLGGIEFENCRVFDSYNRPVVQVDEESSAFGVRDVHGAIAVGKPNARLRLGPNPVNVDLQLVR